MSEKKNYVVLSSNSGFWPTYFRSKDEAMKEAKAYVEENKSDYRVYSLVATASVPKFTAEVTEL